MSEKDNRQLEGRLVRQNEQSMKRSRALVVLIALSCLIALAAVAVSMHTRFSKFDARLTAIAQRLERLSEEDPSDGGDRLENPDTELASLRARLSSLETLQEAMASTAKGALEQMNYVFTVVAAFFGLFALFFAYRQMSADSSREEHDIEMRSLVGSFQNNILTISSLISTLEESFAYRKRVEDQLTKINERAALLETSKEQSELALTRMLDALNAEAVEYYPERMTRATLSQKENRLRLESFARRMDQALSLKPDGHLLNPFCYFVRGLYRSTGYEYELAIRDFRTATEKGKSDLTAPEPRTYAEHHRADIGKRLPGLLASVSHFQGIAHKNIEQYQESIRCFGAAIERDDRHFSSITYLLQVMYFHIDTPFEEVEREYERWFEWFERLLKSDIESVTRSRLLRSLNVLKLNQGNMYVPKPIAATSRLRSDHAKLEDASRALECFWEAYDYEADDLAAFGVAQAMECEGVGVTEWRRSRPDEKFEEAMTSLKRRVAEDPDPLFSVLLYYMLAVCARRLDKEDSSRFYLAQARHSLREVPSHVTSFSPLSKVRLPRGIMLQEMEAFEGRR